MSALSPEQAAPLWRDNGCQGVSRPRQLKLRHWYYGQRQPRKRDQGIELRQQHFDKAILCQGCVLSVNRAGVEGVQRLRLVPKGTILLLVSCPMSARPNHGIPDL